MDTAYAQCFFNPEALMRMFIHFVNHRVIDSGDPITKTLVLMVHTPVQLVMCETGLIPFQSGDLPNYPYSKMSSVQLQFLLDVLRNADLSKVQFQVPFPGRYTAKVPLPGAVAGRCAHFLRKTKLLQCFSSAMQAHPVHTDPHVQNTLCSIIQQRFMAAVALSDDGTSETENALLHLRQLQRC
jgi:hypothetical protein